MLLMSLFEAWRLLVLVHIHSSGIIMSSILPPRLAKHDTGAGEARGPQTHTRLSITSTSLVHQQHAPQDFDEKHSPTPIEHEAERLTGGRQRDGRGGRLASHKSHARARGRHGLRRRHYLDPKAASSTRQVARNESDTRTWGCRQRADSPGFAQFPCREAREDLWSHVQSFHEESDVEFSRFHFATTPTRQLSGPHIVWCRKVAHNWAVIARWSYLLTFFVQGSSFQVAVIKLLTLLKCKQNHVESTLKCREFVCIF